jgi:hypothetical protein
MALLTISFPQFAIVATVLSQSTNNKILGDVEDNKWYTFWTFLPFILEFFPTFIKQIDWSDPKVLCILLI